MKAATNQNTGSLKNKFSTIDLASNSVIVLMQEKAWERRYFMILPKQ